MGVDAAKLEAAVRTGSGLLIDTNVLIAYIEGSRTITDAARILIDEWVRSGRNRAFVSTISAMEVLAGPLKAQRPIADYLDFLQRFPNVTCVSLDLRAAELAAEVRAQSNLKPPDALIIGTAVAVGADLIVTNDAPWSKKSPKPVIVLNDYCTV